MSQSVEPIGPHPTDVNIHSLIAALASRDGLRREKARLTLVDMGEPALAALTQALKDPREQVRWEAAKAISQIGDPSVAPALIPVLEDPSFGVRWLAAEGLIAAGRESLAPLLQALMHHSDSAWIREGAHHVLRTLATERNLHELLAPVLYALDDVEPAIEVPQAARQALSTLEETTT